MTTSAIEVDRLAKTYPGDVEAVKEISFSVEAGEVFGLLGPNGAGKSTTVKMLTTLLSITSGSATVAGVDVASVVYQDPVVERSLSGRQNLELHARLWRVPAAEARSRIAELAATLGLADLLDRAVSSYSGGQRRRLEIARALVSQPRVLFLDEPTVGLDPRIRAELLDVIAGLRDRMQMTILLTTHYLDEAERLCDRIAIIHEGTIVALDAPAALRAELGDKIVELRAAENPQFALNELRSLEIAGDDAFDVGATITIPLRDRNPADVIAAIDAAGVRTTAITSRTPTLDDVYLRLTGGQLAA